MSEIEWGDMTIVDHGYQVITADEYVKCSLNLLAESDRRGVRVGGDTITFGNLGNAVTYTVIGWQADPPCLLLRKGI